MVSPSLPLRERAQGCAHDLEWVRGWREEPLTHSSTGSGELLSPARGEGAIMSTALATPISSQARKRGPRAAVCGPWIPAEGYPRESGGGNERTVVGRAERQAR